MAQCSLGYCYASGNGVVEDEAEAAKWFRKAAKQNSESAQYQLAPRVAVAKIKLSLDITFLCLGFSLLERFFDLLCCALQHSELQ